MIWIHLIVSTLVVYDPGYQQLTLSICNQRKDLRIETVAGSMLYPVDLAADPAFQMRPNVQMLEKCHMRGNCVRVPGNLGSN